MQEFAYQERHMGVSVSLSLILETEAEALTIKNAFFTTIHAYEARFSRFLPSSELSQLNQRKDQIVSPEFMMVLLKSRELYRETAGVFNPLLQIGRYGYDRDFASLPTATKTVIDPAAYDIDFSAVKIDEFTRRVVLRPEQQLDFGGILKGLLAHQLSSNISSRHPHCIGNIVNIGGDLHTRGVDVDEVPFTFFIFNPVTKEDTPVLLRDTSLATSGTYKRTWQTPGGVRHHLLNGQDQTATNSTICSASVICEDGARADAYAKLFLLKDVAEALRITNDPTLQYLLVHQDGSIEKHLCSSL